MSWICYLTLSIPSVILKRFVSLFIHKLCYLFSKITHRGHRHKNNRGAYNPLDYIDGMYDWLLHNVKGAICMALFTSFILDYIFWQKVFAFCNKHTLKHIQCKPPQIIIKKKTIKIFVGFLPVEPQSQSVCVCVLERLWSRVWTSSQAIKVVEDVAICTRTHTHTVSHSFLVTILRSFNSYHFSFLPPSSLWRAIEPSIHPVLLHRDPSSSTPLVFLPFPPSDPLTWTKQTNIYAGKQHSFSSD